MDFGVLELALAELGCDGGGAAAAGQRRWAVLAPPSPPKRVKTKTAK
jgi:hypothetical protein